MASKVPLNSINISCFSSSEEGGSTEEALVSFLISEKLLILNLTVKLDTNKTLCLGECVHHHNSVGAFNPTF